MRHLWIITAACEVVLPSTGIRAAEMNYDRTVAQIEKEVDEHLSAANQLLEQVLAVKGERTIANTLEPANELQLHLDNGSQVCGLFSQVHPDKAVRDTADLGDQRVQKFRTDLSLNRPLYDAYRAIDVSKADGDVRRLMFKTLRDFRRAGVDRDDATREKIKALREELVKLGQQFSNNIRDDVRRVQFDSVTDLEGLPEDFIKGHAPGEDGKITLTTDYPDYIPFMSYAKSGPARHKLYMAYRNRAYPVNIAVLDQLLAKRYELAKLLGYQDYAVYITEDKMIKTATAVTDFIERIARMAEGPAAADMAELLAAKRLDDPKATKVADDEKTYYEERVKAAKYSFDSQKARGYFEFDRVRQGLFDVTARLFGIEFRPVKEVKLWHPDVTCWDVYDGERYVGRFMLDLHPREGKYKHAACFTYQTGIEGKQTPIYVLVCNFPDPRSSSGPALLPHTEVVTFFHEFGHLLHGLFSGHHRWIDISGMSTEWDFVEAPSQMLEEWPWDIKTL
ncbi:MAG TPA: M3 family metallopeptidase, partial [Phycisphaerae bacterium]